MADVGSYTEVMGSNAPIVNSDSRVGGRIIHLKFTHDGTDPLSVTLSDKTMRELAGKYVFKIRQIPDDTLPVTNATDLTIIDSDGYDHLGSNGADFLLSGTPSETLCYNSFLGTNEYAMFSTSLPLTVGTSGNSISGASFSLKFFIVS